MIEEEGKGLTDKERRFCEEYVIDLNKTQAAIRAGYSKKSAKEIGYQNCTKLHIQSYIKELQDNISKATGVTAIRNVLELKKIAYTSFSQLKKDWYNLEDWDELPEDIKAAISEITHSETTFGDNGEKKTVRLKMHNKIKAIEVLNKMLGFNEPEKIEHEINDKIKTREELEEELLKLRAKRENK